MQKKMPKIRIHDTAYLKVLFFLINLLVGAGTKSIHIGTGTGSS